MGIEINKISQKYINQLESKKVLNTVGIKKAVSAVVQAVDETAKAAKKEIESSIQPLKARIATQDEFILNQTKEKQSIQEKNNSLEQKAVSLKNQLADNEIALTKQTAENKKLQEDKKELEAKNKSLDEVNNVLRKSVTELKDKINKYKDIVKEAYRQGITSEIREQKNGIASILSGLIRHKEEIKKPIEIKSIVEAQNVDKIEKSPDIRPQQTIEIKQTKKTGAKISASVPKQKTKETARTTISSEVANQIKQGRLNQILDKSRMEEASGLIKLLLTDAPQKTTYSSIQEHFKKTMDKYVRTVNNLVNGRYRFENDNYGKIRVGSDELGNIILKERIGISQPYKYEIFNHDGSSIEIYDGHSDSYIEFRDKNEKKLLKICYSDDHYGVFISDKNGKLMVAESIKDGVVKYLRVDFNDIKPISAIETDELINTYAQNLIKKAKAGSKSEQKDFRDTTDIDYYNSEGKRTVSEYYVNKKKNPTPIFTYLFNPETQNVEKLISTGDFGIHGKIVKNAYGKPTIIQYRTKGVTGIQKRRKDSELKDFGMGFYKSTENEHFETQSLYDKNYEADKDSFLQRAVYEKRNYGLASYPLTKSFTFHDLTKHNIKPWDFSILKPYIK